MQEHLYRWRNKQLREHVAIIDGKISPTIVLKNATFLNVYIKSGKQQIFGSMRIALCLSAKTCRRK